MVCTIKSAYSAYYKFPVRAISHDRGKQLLYRHTSKISTIQIIIIP